ncbi:MAG: nucleoside kinase [Anaerolineales bacterium]|nr:nucleoside kinase [Anaerolineales bacterium]MCS7247186.1 nucleoside kinase [Anaerolineales bacterium]MDW8160997.1 nucleoside kinase [Anaerolineales bacterium]MDW8446779.1 nucleoside kinase [Anaerolineales bacterium]
MNCKGFSFVKPRKTVEVTLPDGRTIRGPRNAPIKDFFTLLEGEGLPPIVGAIVNDELRELTYPIKTDCSARPVTMGEADGMRIYRRSLTMLLETAFHKLYPNAYLTIDHSVSSGGYFCQVLNRPPLTDAELKELEATMRSMVEADLPLIRTEVPLHEAIQYFVSINADDMVRLLKWRRKPYVTLYELDGFRDYHHGYMVPTTGYLKWFALSQANGGFTLRFPRRHAPTQLLPLPSYSKLLEAFRQYGDWLERLGIGNVGALNDAIEANRAAEIILVSEALHEQMVSNIASMIVERQDQVRVILVAGPSSSGKTTFSKRLAIQLLARGLSPFPLEMDNYFVNREDTPKDDNGNYDFESVEALKWQQLDTDLSNLIAGRRVQLPRYDFISGKSQPGDIVQLSQNHIIILEGIHGLNPKLFQSVRENQIFRIYVSALTQLNLDRHNRVSTTDTRLIRRIVRDSRERGYTAQQTIRIWESVRRGEKRYIFPYQNNADVMFNSALVYELSALKPFAEPLLRQVPHGTPEYIEAKRLLAFLEWFLPIDSNLIPDNSILREFIGDSILKEFKLWKNDLKDPPKGTNENHV